jgi:hypothetical protein
MTEQRPLTESELVDRVRSIDVRAPQELHDRIEKMIAERATPGSQSHSRAASTPSQPAFGRRLAAGLALAAVLVAVLVVALTGGGGGTRGLTVNTAAALTLGPATAAAPHENRRSGGTQLAAAVDGVPYPYWADRFGWRSTGSRIDRVGGRTVRTVFYSNARGQRVGYAIVAGTPAPRTSGGVVVWRDGTAYRLLGAGDMRIVTWLRHGHMCVVSGRGVSSATLLTLASWDDHDRTAA